MDPFYRYSRTPVNIKTQSSKGGETIIENSKVIAEDLFRTIEQIAKYLQYSLNTSQSIKAEKIVLRGIFTKVDIENCLDKLTEDYIKCPICGIPETYYEKEKKYLVIRCKGCGNSTKLEECKYVKFLSIGNP
jgi:translation initiation factor 2 subunit 2